MLIGCSADSCPESSFLNHGIGMKVCKICGKTQNKEMTAGVVVEVTVCRDCKLEQMRKWVPPIFMETDISRIASKKAVDEVINWRPGPVGLVICGPSGAGKTRLMWELVKIWGDSTTPVFSPGPASFGSVMAERYRDGNAEQWASGVANSEIVAFDDVTKMKITDRVEEQFFGIIDYRTCHKLPVIATIQGAGSSLKAVMSEDRGTPIIRRLREFCKVVDM